MCLAAEELAAGRLVVLDEPPPAFDPDPEPEGEPEPERIDPE